MGRWAGARKELLKCKRSTQEKSAAPGISDPLTFALNPTRRPHQQRPAEGGRAADPAGPVQRGLPLPGDAPHAVRRLPQGQEGRLPGDSRGVGQRAGETALLSSPRARPSAHSSLQQPHGKVGLAVPTLWMRKLRVGRLRDWLQIADPRSEETLGARSETQPQLCSLPSERHFAQVTQQRGLDGDHRREAELGRALGHTFKPP